MAWLADGGKTLDRPPGYGWIDNLRIAQETGWRVTPWDKPIPKIERPRYPALGRFGVLIGVIEWGFILIATLLTRDTVQRMPLYWRHNLVEYLNAVSEAKTYRQELDRREAEQEAHDKGLVLGNRTNWR